MTVYALTEDDRRLLREALRKLRQIGPSLLGDRGRPALVAAPAGTVSIRNDSGADRARFDVLGITGATANPAADSESWVLTGTTPAAGHVGRFVILAGAVPKGEIGRAYVSGVTPVMLEMADPSDQWADVKAGDATRLVSGPIGGAQILWSPSPSPKLGLVRVGLPIPGGVPTDDYYLLQLKADGTVGWDVGRAT